MESKEEEKRGRGYFNDQTITLILSLFFTGSNQREQNMERGLLVLKYEQPSLFSTLTAKGCKGEGADHKGSINPSLILFEI